MNEIRAILFDLDDTLYNELKFYRGGFGAIASHLEELGGATRVETLELLLELRHQHDGQLVVQQLARHLGFPIDRVPSLVGVFRAHNAAPGVAA